MLFCLLLGCSFLVSTPIGELLGRFHLLPRPSITKEAYEKIRFGLTLQEVESIIGAPPGDYGPGRGEEIDYGYTSTLLYMQNHPNAKMWWAGTVGIRVCFNKEGLVEGKGGQTIFRAYETPGELICQKLRLCKKRPYPQGSINYYDDLLRNLAKESTEAAIKR
jgi:hypothetical protein